MIDRQEIKSETTVHGVTGGKRFLLGLLGTFYLTWARTIRLRMDAGTREAITYQAEPLIIILWHNALFLGPVVHRRLRHSRRVYGLVSASRDGGQLAYFFDRVGIGRVLGSSSRFGREGFHEIIRCHREGHDISITPDGPRGPAYVMKPGAVLAARRVQSPVLLCGFAFSRSLRLRSWDRFFCPFPFSIVTIRSEIVKYEQIPPGQAGVEYLQTRLMALTGDPDMEVLSGKAGLSDEKSGSEENGFTSIERDTGSV
jgi:lysophospholipid acyltransferase (LPLAT)-like uncharacterized protein